MLVPHGEEGDFKLDIPSKSLPYIRSKLKLSKDILIDVCKIF